MVSDLNKHNNIKPHQTGTKDIKELASQHKTDNRGCWAQGCFYRLVIDNRWRYSLLLSNSECLYFFAINFQPYTRILSGPLLRRIPNEQLAKYSLFCIDGPQKRVLIFA